MNLHSMNDYIQYKHYAENTFMLMSVINSDMFAHPIIGHIRYTYNIHCLTVYFVAAPTGPHHIFANQINIVRYPWALLRIYSLHNPSVPIVHSEGDIYSGCHHYKPVDIFSPCISTIWIIIKNIQ